MSGEIDREVTGEDRVAYVARAMRALALSGRRLVRTSEGWRVLVNADRRRRGRFLLTDEEVSALAEAGRLSEVEAGMYVTADVKVAPAPQVEPWAFIVAARREVQRSQGTGFSALAWRARRGEGPLTMRQVEAGLKLIKDVEQRDNSRGLTMNWDMGPVDKQKRGGTSGGFKCLAMQAATRLGRVRKHMSGEAFKIVWALCIDARTLREIGARFRISRRHIERAIVDALEEAAWAYDC